jgi:Zn-dependent oligopeptidase
MHSTTSPSAFPSVIKFDLKSDELIEKTKEIIGKANETLDRIGSLPAGSCSFESAMKPLALMESDLQTQTAAIMFLQHVSTSPELRDASVEGSKLLDAFYIEKGMREDVFKVSREVEKNEAGKLEDEAKRFLEKVLLGFKQNGLALSETDRAVLKEKRKRLAELCTEYSRNLNEDKTSLKFSKEELDGCTDDFLSGLEKDGDKYIMTTKYPDVAGTLRYAKNETVRNQVDLAFNSRASVNSPILEEAIRVRYECAKLLGYKNHAEFQLEERLAKTVPAVLKFENELWEKLLPLAKKELDLVKGLKKEMTGSDSFRTWDLQFFSRIIMERDYAVDEEKLKEYFSLETVVAEMLKIYEEVLGLKFVIESSVPVWHEDVKAIRVKDAASGEDIGLFFLDLYPRDGKYSHAACFPLVPGCQLADGSRQLPVSAIVANFSKPSASKPSLLKHDEVTTLFHELGHAMHDMCAKVTFSRFHGTSVETDFVEAPSQMLENWCWDPKALKRLSKHYLHGTPLDDSLIVNLIKTKNFNAGLANLRQVFFALFDMTIHSIESPAGLPNNETINQLYARLRKQITMLEQPEGACPPASFGHMMGGYDAGYYGYLWSEVFSADMFFSRFETEGLQSAKTGMDYRREILTPGGSRDGMDSLRGFLGRDPNPEAFLHSIGL